MSDLAVEAGGLRRSYGPHQAVKAVDLSVARGEVFGFLGTNGAGKTTTIVILEGYRDRSAAGRLGDRRTDRGRAGLPLGAAGPPRLTEQTFTAP